MVQNTNIIQILDISPFEYITQNKYNADLSSFQMAGQIMKKVSIQNMDGKIPDYERFQILGVWYSDDYHIIILFRSHLYSI